MKSASISVFVLALTAACASRSDRDPNATSGGAAGAALSAGIEPSYGAVSNELFRIDDLLAHRSGLSLSPTQNAAIDRAVDDATTRITELDIELQAAKASLIGTLRAPEVDEGAAIRATMRITELESAIKISHLTTLVRLKNILEPAQEERLRRLAH